MNTKSNYMIVRENSAEELEASVSDLMHEGWIPTGGIAVYKSSADRRRFYQAMIKNPR